MAANAGLRVQYASASPICAASFRASLLRTLAVTRTPGRCAAEARSMDLATAQVPWASGTQYASLSRVRRRCAGAETPFATRRGPETRSIPKERDAPLRPKPAVHWSAAEGQYPL